MKVLIVFLITICRIISVSAQWTVNLTGASGFARIDAVHFIDEHTGFVGGGTNAITGGNGVISKTTNKGASWTIVKTITGASIKDIFFVNNLLGFAVGTKGLIAKTTDGGNTWNTQTFNHPVLLSPEPFLSVHFVDQNKGYIAGGFNDQMVLETTDGGANWTMLQTLPSSTFQRLHGIHFTDGNTGFAVGGEQFGGGYGKIYHTADAGSFWDTINSGVTTYFNAVHFLDANTGFIVGWNGVILKTSDGGQNWYMQTNQDPNLDEIGDISFTNSLLGYACTLEGKILKTTDGGNTWVVDGDVSSQIPSLYDIAVPSQNFGIAGGLGGVYAEMGTGTAIEDFKNDMPEVSVYPNPFTVKTTVDCRQCQNALFKLFDLNGKELVNGKLLENQTVIEKGNLSEGVYFLQLKDENKIAGNHKLIIQ